MSNAAIVFTVLGVTAFAAVLAFGLILWRIGQLKRAVKIAKSWPTVPGRVVAGSIHMRTISLPRGGRGVSYGVIVGYEYEVKGRRYRSERYSLSGPQYVSFEKRAKRLLGTFPIGTSVTVSYDPAAPEAGVIALNAPTIVVLRWVFWICLAVVAWLLGGLLLFEPVLGPRPLIRL